MCDTDNKKQLIPIQPSLTVFVMQAHTAVSESWTEYF